VERDLGDKNLVDQRTVSRVDFTRDAQKCDGLAVTGGFWPTPGPGVAT
jgi:hypothetical protein